MEARKTTILAIAISGLFSASPSFAEAEPALRELPVDGPLYLRETQSGDTVITSEDGRFVMPGRIVDREKGHEVLTTIEQFDRVYENDGADPAHETRRDSSSADSPFNPDGTLNEDALFTFTVGDEGSEVEDVFVFMDPQCPHCHSVLEMQPALTESYRFHNIILATMGEQSERVVSQLNCMDADAVRQAFLNQESSFQQSARRESCDTAGLRNNNRLAEKMGVDMVPVVVNPGGEYAVGAPQSESELIEFLEGSQ